jgi:hypothetical protein
MSNMLLGLLPTMWRASEGQNQLRLALFTLTTKLVEVRSRGVGHAGPVGGRRGPRLSLQALQEASAGIYAFAVPMVQYACDPSQVRAARTADTPHEER